jgi:hypothetical protein
MFVTSQNRQVKEGLRAECWSEVEPLVLEKVADWRAAQQQVLGLEVRQSDPESRSPDVASRSIAGSPNR